MRRLIGVVVLGAVFALTGTILPAVTAGALSPSSQMVASSPTNLAGGPNNGDVSCVAALSCTAVWSDPGGIMVANEVVGSWQSPHLLPWNRDLSNALLVFKISCWALGNCMVIGVETNGSWGSLSAMPTGGTDVFGHGVSCVAPGWCLIVSNVGAPTYDVSYTVWQGGNFSGLHDTGLNFANLPQVSCWAVEQCRLFDSTGYELAMASYGVSSPSGWSSTQGINLGAYSFVDASCTSATFCAVVGWTTSTVHSIPSIAWMNGTTWHEQTEGSLVTCQTNPQGCSPGFSAISCVGTFCLFGGMGLGASSGTSEIFEGSLLGDQVQLATPDVSFTDFMGVSCSAAWTCGQVSLDTLDRLTAITNLPALTINGPTTTSVSTGELISIDLHHFISGGDGLYLFQPVGPLPSGLTFDQSTGMLSGTLDSVGTFTSTFSVSSTGPPDQTITLAVPIVVSPSTALASTGASFSGLGTFGTLVTLLGATITILRRRYGAKHDSGGVQ